MITVVASASLGKRPAPLDNGPPPLKKRYLRLSRPSAVYRSLQISRETAQTRQEQYKWARNKLRFLVPGRYAGLDTGR